MKHGQIRDKFLKGGQLAIQRLLERKKRDNAYVVVSQEGKVIKVAAKDLKQ